MKHTFLAALFVLPCLALPALPALAEGAAPPTPRAAHAKVTWQQKFAQANTTHDGHLTAEQAKTGYASLFKHFIDIDTGKRGFVTLEDVKAWHKQQRAQHHPAPDNRLRPHHALHHVTGAPPALKTSTDSVVPNATATVGPDAPRVGDVPG